MRLEKYQLGGPVGSYVPAPRRDFIQDTGVVDSAIVQRERYDKGVEDYNTLNRALGSIQTLKGDEYTINNRSKIIKDQLDSFVRSGAWEHSKMVVDDSMTGMMSDHELVNSVQSRENYMQGEKAKAEARAQGLIFHDFDKVPIKDPVTGDVMRDADGKVMFGSAADTHVTAKDGVYNAKFEKQLDFAGKARELVQGIKADDYRLEQLSSATGIPQSQLKVYFQKGGGISQSKIDRIAEALLPMYENTTEGDQQKRALMQLELNGNGNLHSEMEARQQLLGYLKAAAAPQQHYQYELEENPFVIAAIKNSGQESAPGTNILYTSEMQENNAVAETFTIPGGDVFGWTDGTFGQTFFNPNGGYQSPGKVETGKTLGTGKSTYEDFGAGAVKYDNILKEVDYDLSKLDYHQLDKLRANSKYLAPWIMEKSEYAKPENRANFTKIVNGQEVPMNDAEFAQSVVNIMTQTTAVKRAQFDPDDTPKIAMVLGNSIPSLEKFNIIGEHGEDIKFKDWIAEQDDDLGAMYFNDNEKALQEVKDGLRNVATNKTGGDIPKTYISYNVTGNKTGSLHFSTILSNGEKLEFDAQPFENYSQYKGAKVMKVIQDNFNSKKLTSQNLGGEIMPSKSAGLMNLVKRGIIDANVPVQAVLKNEVKNGQMEPTIYYLQNGVSQYDESAWNTYNELSMIYMGKLQSQNNTLVNGFNNFSQIRQK